LEFGRVIADGKFRFLLSGYLVRRRQHPLLGDLKAHESDRPQVENLKLEARGC
jgi:hypothetical protein